MTITVNGQVIGQGSAGNGSVIVIGAGAGGATTVSLDAAGKAPLDIQGRAGTATIDDSVRTILMHRGMTALQADHAIADMLEAGDGRLVLDETLPNIERGDIFNGRYTFRAALSPGVSWTGYELRVDNTDMPETLLNAMVGRRMGTVIEHPALPSDRVITSASMDEQTLVVTVASVQSRIARPRGLRAEIRSAVRRTLRMNRRTIEAECGQNHASSTLFGGVTVAMMLMIIMTYVIAAHPGIGGLVTMGATFAVGLGITALSTFLFKGMLFPDMRTQWNREQDIRWKQALAKVDPEAHQNAI